MCVFLGGICSQFLFTDSTQSALPMAGTHTCIAKNDVVVIVGRGGGAPVGVFRGRSWIRSRRTSSRSGSRSAHVQSAQGANVFELNSFGRTLSPVP